jgi:hypothetical protein
MELSGARRGRLMAGDGSLHGVTSPRCVQQPGLPVHSGPSRARSPSALALVWNDLIVGGVVIKRACSLCLRFKLLPAPPGPLPRCLGSVQVVRDS